MSLNNIKREITQHPTNAWAKDRGYQPIYTASVLAKLMIVGQAPGRKAQESHIPWNDASGDTLRDWLGISRDEFYDEDKVALVPMDFFYPGKGAHGDLPPRKDFAPLWHPRIIAEMPNIQLTLLIGSYAQKYYLGDKAERTLTDTVKNYNQYLPEFLPLVHPSPLNFRWRSKNPWFEDEIVPHLRKLVQQILT